MRRESVGDDERHGARHGLLGAAVRITVKLGQQRRHVEARGRADRQVDARARRDQIVDHIRADVQLAARFQRRDRRAFDVASRRQNLERHFAFDGDVVRTGDDGLQRKAAEILRLEGDALHLPLACLKFDRLVGDRRQRFVAVVALLLGQRQFVRRVRAIDVVQIEAELHLVAECHEARHGNGQRHRIADDQVAGTVADFIVAPCHGHHAHGAVEVGQLEADVRGAVFLHADDAGIERDNGFDGRIALHRGAARVAARAELAAVGAHAVDQTTVEVADFKRQLLLLIEPFLRSRCLVAREIQDAEIDSGDGDARVFAGG